MSFFERMKAAWVKGWNEGRTELVQCADGVCRPGIPASVGRVARGWWYVKASIRGLAYVLREVVLGIAGSRVVKAIRKVTGHPVGMFGSSVGVLYGIDCLLAFLMTVLPAQGFVTFVVALLGICLWFAVFYFVVVSFMVLLNWMFKKFYRFMSVPA